MRMKDGTVISVFLEREDAEEIRRTAERLGVSISAIVRMCIKQALKNSITEVLRKEIEALERQSDRQKE